MHNLPVYADKMTRSTTVYFPLWLSWYILIILQQINSKEVIIQDGHMDNWSDKGTSGLTFSLPKGSPLKGGWDFLKQSKEFSTCGTGVEADFWFTTKPIYWSKTFPEVIHVDVEAEITMCNKGGRDLFPCFSNKFEVYIYPGEYDKKFDQIDTEDVKDFRPLYNITNNTSPDATLIRSKHTFSFHSQNLSHVVTFGIRSRGACGKIFRMRMYYYYCEKAFVEGIKFEETASPDKESETTVKGNCSENAVTSTNDTSPKGNCTYNGTWNVGENVTCMCVEKFALDKQKGICSALLILNEKPNVARIAYGVNITWGEPTNRQNESILYDVNCFICNKSVTICTTPCVNETYNPRQMDLNMTWVIVSNLTVDATYMFRVYAKNHLNDEVPKQQWRYVKTDRVVVKLNPDTTTGPPTTRNGSITTSRPTNKSTSDDNDWIMYIIIGAAAMVLFILIILLIIYARRR